MSNQEENQDQKTVTGGFKLQRRWIALAIVIILALITIAALMLRKSSDSGGLAGRPVPRVDSAAGPGTVVPQVPGEALSAMPADLTIQGEMVDRMRLEFADVSRQSMAEQLRTSGTVQPNTYRETPVNPIVSGRITGVRAELGQTVRVGQILATIHSAELADAQMKYLTVDANLQFHVAQAKRFEKLAEIGAVSKQEMEDVVARLREHHAEHASLREKMLLYGLNENEIQSLKNASQVQSEVPVHSPISGVITERNINIGQVLTMQDKLFVVTDLSSIWVIANVYEKDFAVMRLGTPVTITTPSYPGVTFRGTISYVDPLIDQQTRTAKARIEVPNPRQLLKLGMYVDAMISTGSMQQSLAIPKAALQTVGSDHVVFVPLGDGRFQMRRVQIEQGGGDLYRVLSGVSEGEKVVTEGSFFLRAEMGRTQK